MPHRSQVECPATDHRLHKKNSSHHQECELCATHQKVPQTVWPTHYYQTWNIGKKLYTTSFAGN
uniref:GCM domain-containing protein n=1 Tax=Macrostomum lignano TaxID=282301 RepID=A0A1I8J4M3_9PLAT